MKHANIPASWQFFTHISTFPTFHMFPRHFHIPSEAQGDQMILSHPSRQLQRYEALLVGDTQVLEDVTGRILARQQKRTTINYTQNGFMLYVYMCAYVKIYIYMCVCECCTI